MKFCINHRGKASHTYLEFIDDEGEELEICIKYAGNECDFEHTLYANDDEEEKLWNFLGMRHARRLLGCLKDSQ